MIMRRSILFIPANSPAMLQNADIFDADSVIFDLEDAISVNEKDSARILLTQFLFANKLDNIEVCVRINDIATSFFLDDLAAIVSRKVDTIVLPKASVEAIKTLDKILLRYELDRSLNKNLEIIPIIETTAAVSEIEQIAALPRVSGILLGAEDLTSDLEVKRTLGGQEIFYPRVKIAYACKANKIDAIDTPFTNTKDEAGLKADCETAYSLGLNAKSAIHPNQISVINEIFSPSLKDIEYARKVVMATEEAKKQNKGVFSLDGKMIDKPIIERAEKVLAKAKKFNLE
jgi:citrate lyase subunit beta/citryl-CoA lyase